MSPGVVQIVASIGLMLTVMWVSSPSFPRWGP